MLMQVPHGTVVGGPGLDLGQLHDIVPTNLDTGFKMSLVPSLKQGHKQAEMCRR